MSLSPIQQGGWDELPILSHIANRIFRASGKTRHQTSPIRATQKNQNPKTTHHKTIMLNMTKAYRAELRDMKRNRKKVERDLRKAYLDAQRCREKVIRETNRFLVRAEKCAKKALVAIDRRIGVIEGRLS